MTTRAPMREELHKTVLERIVRGELRPGSRINESGLAEELGGSRTPLREALFLLESEGFVRAEMAKGFSVGALSGRDVREAYPILWTLEELALRVSTPVVYSLVERLAKINDYFAKAAEPKDAIERDSQWHQTLIGSCPNRRLIEMIESQRSSVKRYEHVYMLDPSLISESVRQHQKIIDAIMLKNIEAAGRELVENWKFSMDILLVRLGEP